MIETSALYKRLLAEEHSKEIRLVIGDGSISSGYTESEIVELKTYNKLFDKNMPLVGCAVAGQIDVSLIADGTVIPRMAKLSPYIRLTSADGTEHSEWIQKGVYFIDTRETTHNDYDVEVLHLTGYDALLKAQADYPSDSSASYPKSDVNIVKLISYKMGLGNSSGSGVDSRTWSIMTGGYTYGLEVMAYSMQEVLSSIAIPYAGNWIMTDSGKLRLVSFADIPKETRLLTDEVGYRLVFGNDRILV